MPPSNPGTLLVDLLGEDKEFMAVEEEMQSTIREHRDNGHSGGVFCRYNIVRVSSITKEAAHTHTQNPQYLTSTALRQMKVCQVIYQRNWCIYHIYMNVI